MIIYKNTYFSQVFMAEENNQITDENIIINWMVPEYEAYERSKSWYIAASIIAVIVLIYALWTANFLFVVIIVLAATVIILNDNGNPENVGFAIADEGLIIGQKFIDFDELKNFSIIYKPRQNTKQIYFEFHNVLRPRLSIQLNNMNPLKIRDILLNYLQEDLERENEPFSERIGKLFKI